MNEFRHQPLYDEWVVVAPNRVRKPPIAPQVVPQSEISDPFLTGNESKTPPEIYAIRENSSIPASWKTRVFPNKFPLLELETPPVHSMNGVYSSIGGFGAHEMVVDQPKPNKHICQFNADEFKDLLLTFRDRFSALYQDQRIASVVAFKNQGIKAGNAIPHSHSQIIALPFIAPRLAKQIETSREHYSRVGRCLLCDQIASEENEKSRILVKNRYFIAFAPFAPRYEFETWVAPIVHCSSFTSLTKDALNDLGETLEWCAKRLGIALEKPDLNLLLFTDPPKRNHRQADYFHHIERFFHWHIELLPRERSAGGFETSSGCFVNPIAPETYAAYLKEMDIETKKKDS
jgi:UDPglucose--hexose-1-phosphate uridylyltransferase